MSAFDVGSIDWQAIDGYRFQELCMDLLAVEGFDVQDQGVGPDGGIDAILSQTMKLPDNTSKQLRWAAQFKYKQSADATVKPRELGNIVNVLDRFQAEGFFLITNGRVTHKAYCELRGATNVRHPPYLLSVWTRREIEEKVYARREVSRRYFPTFAFIGQPTVTVEITLDLPIEQFSDREQNTLRYALAAFLDIPITTIDIKEILKGSTKVIIALPADSAHVLQQAFEGNSLSLKVHGFQHTVLTIRQADDEGADTSVHQEWLRSKIIAISPRELEGLTAALLRALGYFTGTSPMGEDRGIDVLATRDPLGLLDPHFKVQVKHRPNRRMSAPEIRELVGALRRGDRGLCVSTGGFSREARYEAERSEIPVRLVDLDELTLLILRHYDQFDPAWRALLPLKLSLPVRIRRPNR